MAQDNALQAPAQGFGQDISFAVRTTNPPVLDGLGRQGQTRGGVQGSPGTGSGFQQHAIQAPPPNPTIALLNKVAGQYMEGKIKEQKAAAFVSGMQRAAGGEAIKDIAEGQPWYTRIFGESDVIEGARVYTAQAKSAEAAAAIEDSMSEVRKMGPEESNAYFAKLIAGHMTGDDVADAAIMQGFARTMPSTMRRQAKEHYAWRQEEASTAESRALLAFADLQQKRAGSDKQTDDEYAQQAVQLVSGMRPAQGRDMDSWTKARTGDLVALAQAGKFHAVNTLREAGLLGMLPPEARTKVESALDTAENRVIATKSFEYADEIGQIAGEAEVYHDGLAPQRTFEQLRALNEKFRKETGIDRDLISLDKAGGIVKDVHTTLLREGERRTREAEAGHATLREKGAEADAEALLVSTAHQLAANGTGNAAVRSPKLKPVFEREFPAVFRQQLANGPEAAADLLFRNWRGDGQGDGYVSKDVADSYVRRVDMGIGAQMPGDWLKLGTEAAALKAKSPALLDAYFGKHAGRMEAYLGSLSGGMNEMEAYAYAMAAEPPKRATLKKDELVEARRSLATMADNPAWKFWAKQGIPLREDQQGPLLAELSPLIAKYRGFPGVSPDQATQRAWAELQRERGADMLGGFGIVGQAGHKPLLSMLRDRAPGETAFGTGDDAEERWGEVLQTEVHRLAKEHGADPADPINLIRNPDTEGGKVGNLFVGVTAKDGRMLYVPLSTRDLKAAAAKPLPKKEPVPAAAWLRGQKD